MKTKISTGALFRRVGRLGRKIWCAGLTPRKGQFGHIFKAGCETADLKNIAPTRLVASPMRAIVSLGLVENL